MDRLIFARNAQKVVSFDWDGTAVTPDLSNPAGIQYGDDDEPISVIIPAAAELMRMYASQGAKIVIVTCRNPEGLESVRAMISECGLPVSEVYATSHTSKAPTLRSVGATIHYDDSPFRINEIKDELGPAIEVIHAHHMDAHIAGGGHG